MLKLRRITSSGKFVPEVDGLRFVAIASVFLYHVHGSVLAVGVVAGTNDFFQPIVEHGYRGVNLFYVISGFILGLPFAAHYLAGRPPVSIKSYFLRRLTRLEPPYILNLLVCFALLVLIQGGSARTLLPHLGASLIYLHNVIFGQQSAINPVAWTLEVEVQFYCLAPLLASVFAMRSRMGRRIMLAGIIFLAGILQTAYWDAPSGLKLTILYAIQFFLAGFFLADIYLVDWKERPAPDWRWDLLALLCWPLIFLPGDLTVWIYLPFLMLAVYITAFRGVVFNRIFRNPFITITGGMCYTIYLFHYQLIPAVLPLTKALHIGGGFDLYFALQVVFVAPIVLLIGGVYFVLVERPCMERDWPRRAWNAITTATIGSSSTEGKSKT